MRNSITSGTIAVTFALGCAPSGSWAEEDMMIDIAAQPLGSAIAELGRETGLNVGIAQGLTEGRTSPAIEGRMSPREALDLLLQDTGLKSVDVTETSTAVTRDDLSDPSDEDETFDLGTLTVTGERVERDVFSTNSSVRVFSGEEIEQEVQSSEFERLIDSAANINVQGISNNTPVIRGVNTAGAGGAISGQIPRANVTVDGRRLDAFEFQYGLTSVWDVEAVEVFRGPQTTSQGANSIAGAINIRTRDPQFFNESAARLEIGSDSRFLASVLFNRVLSDSVALRFTYEDQQEDGYINFPNGIPPGSDAETSKLKTARLKLLWEPQEILGLTSQLTFSYTDFSRPQTQIVLGPDFRAQNSNNLDGFPGAFTGDTRAVVHDIAYDFGNGWSVRNQFQFSRADISRVTGAPGEVAASAPSDDLANELIFQYAPDNGALSGILGFYYQDIETDADSSAAIVVDDKRESRAVFAEVTYDFGNGFDATTGIRYQKSSQRRFLSSAIIATDINYDETFDEWLPRFSIGYEPTDDLRFSFQVSRGFNPGGVGASLLALLGAIPVPDPVFEFDEETVTNYELAMRGRFLEDRLFVSANLFFSDYEDYQFAVPTILPGNFVDNIISNAEGVETYGLEVEAQFQASDQLSFTGALGLLHTEVTAFDASAAPLVGNELPDAPEVNASLGINYAVTDEFQLGAQVRYTGGYFSDINNSPEFKVPDRTTVDVNARYALTDNAEMYFYVNNIFDEISPLFLFNSSGRVAGVTTEPREFGFGVRATW